MRETKVTIQEEITNEKKAKVTILEEITNKKMVTIEVMMKEEAENTTEVTVTNGLTEDSGSVFL